MAKLLAGKGSLLNTSFASSCVRAALRLKGLIPEPGVIVLKLDNIDCSTVSVNADPSFSHLARRLLQRRLFILSSRLDLDGDRCFV